MRIEILVDGEEPRIFPLKKSQMMIGALDTCDIVLQYTGISRKHILLIVDNDKYYLIDQGSLNGSYINEERLAPGRKIEFTSFFPVRLGDRILITLISDDDAHDMMNDQGLVSNIAKIGLPMKNAATTQMLSLKELQPPSTTKLEQSRQQIAIKKKIQAKRPAPRLKEAAEDRNRMRMVKLGAIALVSVAVYFNFGGQEDPVAVTPTPAPVQATAQPGTAEAPSVTPPKPSTTLVAEADLVPKEKFSVYVNDFKCVAELEKYFCDKIPGALNPGWGVIQVGTMVNIILDGKALFEKAQLLLPALKGIGGANPTQFEIDKYNQDLRLTAFVLFIHEVFPKDLDYSLMKDVQLTFAFFVDKEKDPSDIMAVAMTPASLEQLKQTIEPRHIDNTKKYGGQFLQFLQKFFHIY